MERSEKAAYAIAVFGLGGLLISLAGPDFVSRELQPYLGYGGLALMLLAGAYVGALHVEALRRQRMIPLAGMIVFGLAFVASVVVYFWPRPIITWQFDKPDQYFLGLSGAPPVYLTSFQGRAHNNGPQIYGIESFIRAGEDNKIFEVYLLTGRQRETVKPENTSGIPADSDFEFTAPFVTTGRLDINEFMRRYVPFTFVFKYDGNSYERKFTADDIRNLVSKFENETRPKPDGVTRR
jgi:hypothetical protein